MRNSTNRARRTRRLSVVLCAATAPIAALAAAPPAAAHPCAEVRVWVSGNSTPIGGCHFPGDPGDICLDGDQIVGGNGVGYTACAFVPVR